MDFLAVVSAVFAVLMLCIGVVGGLCPRLLKDGKTGAIPNRGEAMLGGIVIGSLLLLLSLYLSSSDLLRKILIFVVPAAIVCSAIYGVAGAIKEARPPRSEDPVTQEIHFQLGVEGSHKKPHDNSDETNSNHRHHDRSDGINFNHPLGQAIAPMLRIGDWDGARQFLQKVAYGMPTATEEEKNDFTEFMAGFSAQDPLYQRCLVDIQDVLKEYPEGIRQTALYPHMTAALVVEQARYMLYYAEVLGDIVRVKKGNSYTVFPAGTVVAPAAPKKKKQRAIRSAPESEITERSK